MSKSKDNVAKGQGIDGDKDINWVVKQVDKKAERDHCRLGVRTSRLANASKA